MSDRRMWTFLIIVFALLIVLYIYRRMQVLRLQIPGSGTDEVIVTIARAIARNEGFYVSGSRPARNRNPGDLTVDTINKSIGRDSGGIVIYANDDDGWQALYRQVELFFSGSSFYNADQTILETARIYAPAESQTWAANVARSLGVTINTTWSQLT